MDKMWSVCLYESEQNIYDSVPLDQHMLYLIPSPNREEKQIILVTEKGPT
jgi:hypothetical protein